MLWWLADDPILRPEARSVLNSATTILVSVATMIDIWYLAHKRQSPITVEQAEGVCDLLASGLLDRALVVPITTSTLTGAWSRIDRERLRDPWDRLILATAVDRSVPLVTRDRAMIAIGLAEVIEA